MGVTMYFGKKPVPAVGSVPWKSVSVGYEISIPTMETPMVLGSFSAPKIIAGPSASQADMFATAQQIVDAWMASEEQDFIDWCAYELPAVKTTVPAFMTQAGQKYGQYNNVDIRIDCMEWRVEKEHMEHVKKNAWNKVGKSWA